MRSLPQPTCGDIFGELKVILPFARRKRDNLKVALCACSCGSPLIAVRISDLRHPTKPRVSCGCQKGGKPTHGMSFSAEYSRWHKAKRRITDLNDKRFADYGGRGLTMEPDWIASFEAFYADLGPLPSTEHTLERYDNEKGYIRGNVGWELMPVQARNKRNTRFVEYNGKRMCLADAARAAGLTPSIVNGRIHRGMSPEEALSIPRQRQRKCQQPHSS